MRENWDQRGLREYNVYFSNEMLWWELFENFLKEIRNLSKMSVVWARTCKRSLP